MGIDYRPAAYRSHKMAGPAQAEALPYRILTRGLPKHPVAARRPDGSLITLGDLPDPHSRWTRRRKQAVVECVEHGLLSPEAAGRRFQITDSELAEWRATFAASGVAPQTWPDRPRLVVSGTVRRDGLAIDLDRKVVMLDGEVLALSEAEWTVLATIAEADGEIVSAAMLMGVLYDGSSRVAGIKIVDVLLCRLRRKLGAAAERLQAVWGRGYFLAA